MKLSLMILLIIVPALVIGKPKGKSLKQIVMYNSPIIGEGMPTQLIIKPNSLKQLIVGEADNNPLILKRDLKISESNYQLIDSIITVYEHSNLANQGGSMTFLYKIERIDSDGHSSTFTLNTQNTRSLLTVLIATVGHRKDKQQVTEQLDIELKQAKD